MLRASRTPSSPTTACHCESWLSELRTGQKVRRSEEHTSELQSLAYLVCRLLLEKKKTEQNIIHERPLRLCARSSFAWLQRQTAPPAAHDHDPRLVRAPRIPDRHHPMALRAIAIP